MPDRPALTALHDQAEMACRDELDRLAETYRRLTAIGHSDAQATADITAMLQERDSYDLGMCLAFAARKAARDA